MLSVPRPGARTGAELGGPGHLAATCLLLVSLAVVPAVHAEVGHPERSIVGVPQFRHSSETGYGIGVKVLALFRSANAAPRAHTSSLGGSIVVTQEDQVSGSLVTDVTTPDGRLSVKTRFGYRNMPQRFYGIGPETPGEAEEIYTPDQTRFYVEVFRRLTPQFEAGLRYEFENVDISEIEPGGQLAAGSVRGSDGMTVSGVGFLTTWDTRDQSYAPSTGTYVETHAYAFHDALGSEYDFQNFIVDVRRFWSLSERNVLGAQVFWYHVSKYAPFERLASLGGRSHSRGYRRDRYLDRSLLAMQAELRFAWRPRFGLVAFGGVAAVGRNFGYFQLEQLRPMVGVGARVGVIRLERVNLRFDAAMGLETPRFYLSLSEAF